MALLGLRRDRLFAEIVFQQASVTDEGGVEGGSGNIKTSVSVEETEPDKIRPHKSPEGTESCFGGRPTRTFFDSRIQIEIGKVVNLRYVLEIDGFE